MKTTTFEVAALLSALAITTTAQAQTASKYKMTTEIPPEITTPDTVETRIGTLKFFDGFPDDATAQKVYDNLDFQRGVQAFLTAMPGASAEAARVGFATQGADNNQTVLIMENLMDSKSLFLTANTESDFGRVGPDKNKGGKFLLLPPGYTGEVPEGYFVLRSKTYGNLVFWRGFLDDGSTKTAVENSKRFAKVYRVSDAGNPPPMKATGRPGS